MKAKDSPALAFLQVGWDSLPYRSHRNVNSVMQQILDAAISGGMRFESGDFSEIYSRFRAHYWIGESREGFYSLACKAQAGTNISAAIAYETHMKRPAVLWPETTKTPERLYVRAQFNWKGTRLTVTSMASDHLIGCSYHSDSRDVKSRVRVKYSDLQAARKEFDDNRRKWEKEIAAAKNLEELEEIGKRFPSTRDGFRHFDIEILRTKFLEAGNAMREKASKEESEAARKRQAERDAKLAETHDADLARWVAGEKVERYFNEVRLRIKGEVIETSTGFAASAAAVREAIPFVKRFRKKGWKSNGSTKDIDEHPIESVTPEGVQVGCTFVAWSEILRIEKLL